MLRKYSVALSKLRPGRAKGPAEQRPDSTCKWAGKRSSAASDSLSCSSSEHASGDLRSEADSSALVAATWLLFSSLSLLLPASDGTPDATSADILLFSRRNKNNSTLQQRASLVLASCLLRALASFQLSKASAFIAKRVYQSGVAKAEMQVITDCTLALPRASFARERLRTKAKRSISLRLIANGRFRSTKQASIVIGSLFLCLITRPNAHPRRQLRLSANNNCFKARFHLSDVIAY